MCQFTTNYCLGRQGRWRRRMDNKEGGFRRGPSVQISGGVTNVGMYRSRKGQQPAKDPRALYRLVQRGKERAAACADAVHAASDLGGGGGGGGGVIPLGKR